MLANPNNFKIRSVKKTHWRSFARAFGFDKKKVNGFFNLLEEVHAKGNCSQNRIYNVDESDLTVVQNKIAVVHERK